jgi:hypothetical protein
MTGAVWILRNRCSAAMRKVPPACVLVNEGSALGDGENTPPCKTISGP